MKIDVSHLPLYRNIDAEAGRNGLLQVLFPVDLEARRCYVYNQSSWYEGDLLPNGEDSCFWFVKLPYPRFGMSANDSFFTLINDELKLSGGGQNAQVFRQAGTGYGGGTIDIVPLPPESRQISFHGLSDDRTQRLIVVRSSYYTGDARFYQVYLGDSFLLELPRLHCDTAKTRSVEEYPAGRIFAPAGTLEQLRVPVSQMEPAHYGNTTFTWTASRIDFEEGLDSIRFKLREA